MYETSPDIANPLERAGTAKRPPYIPYELQTMEKLTAVLEENMLKLAERLTPIMSAGKISGADKERDQENAPQVVMTLRQHNNRLSVIVARTNDILQSLEI